MSVELGFDMHQVIICAPKLVSLTSLKSSSGSSSASGKGGTSGANIKPFFQGVLAKIPALPISSKLLKDRRWSWASSLPVQKPYCPAQSLKTTPVRGAGCVRGEQRPSGNICDPWKQLVWDSPSPWWENSELLAGFCFQSWVCLSDSKGCWATWMGAKKNVDADPAK